MITGKQARYLRALGHSLKPLLQVGKFGVTDSFVSQVRKNLETHELIKVKLGKSSEVDLKAMAKELTERVPCELAQTIGKTALLYMRKEEDPTIILPE